MRIFGGIDGVNEGDVFSDRNALAEAGIHNPTQKGISGSQSEGADSIVLSGGYEDDQDLGNVSLKSGRDVSEMVRRHTVP